MTAQTAFGTLHMNGDRIYSQEDYDKLQSKVKRYEKALKELADNECKDIKYELTKTDGSNSKTPLTCIEHRGKLEDGERYCFVCTATEALKESEQ